MEDFDRLHEQKMAILAKQPEPIYVKHSGLIQTIQDFHFKTGNFTEEEDYERYCDNRDLNDKHRDTVVERILAADMAIYVMRRVAHVAGEAIQAMRDIRRDLISQYESFHGEYPNVNKDIDF